MRQRLWYIAAIGIRRNNRVSCDARRHCRDRAEQYLVSPNPSAIAGQAGPSRILSRLGVASRLLLAFLGISALAMVGAGVAIFSFREIGEVLDRITARRVHAALASQEVSRQAERLL